MADKTLSTARLAEAIRKAGIRPAEPFAASVPLPALVPASPQAPSEPRPSNGFARTAGGRDHRAAGLRRRQGHRVPAHRPRRVPGRG